MVYALDVEQIVFFQFSQQPFILRAIKIFAGLLIGVDMSGVYMDFTQRNALALIILIPTADTDVTVDMQNHIPCLSCIFHKCSTYSSGR